MRDPTAVSVSRSLRQTSTKAEQVLWRHLRSHALGVRFRRQHPIPPYFADFAAPTVRIVVEVDGSQHGDDADARRDAAMIANGWRVPRFWNNDVLTNTEGVLRAIAETIRERQG